MKLSTVTLTRERQICILQGMIHVAPGGLFNQLQYEMNKYHGYGFQVFYECIQGGPELFPDGPESQKDVALLMGSILMFMPFWAEASHMQFQGFGISYPKDAIVADIKFAEMIALIAGEGLTVPDNLKKFLQGIKKLMAEAATLSEGEARRILQGLEQYKDDVKRFFEKDFVAVMDSVVLRHRNQAAIGVLREFYWSNMHARGFIHYGEDHVPGLQALLERESWRVCSVEKIEVGGTLVDGVLQ